MRKTPFLALALMLAACDQTTATPEPDAAAPDSGPATQEMAANSIPARFHGVWDAETGTCDPASDMRMTINAQTIEFYESVGTVTGADVSGADNAVLDLAMEGEGDSWTQAMELALEGEGADAILYVMHRNDDEGTRGGVPLRLIRCAA